jgi:hypothetical protein
MSEAVEASTLQLRLAEIVVVFFVSVCVIQRITASDISVSSDRFKSSH